MHLHCISRTARACSDSAEWSQRQQGQQGLGRHGTIFTATSAGTRPRTSASLRFARCGSLPGEQHLQPGDAGEALVEEATGAALHRGDPRTQRRRRGPAAKAACTASGISAAGEDGDAVCDRAAARVCARPHWCNRGAVVEPPAHGIASCLKTAQRPAAHASSSDASNIAAVVPQHCLPSG